MLKNFTAASAALALSAAIAGNALAGNVVGTVKFAGPASPAKKIEKTKDVEVCGKIANTAEDMIVGAGGGLKNVVVMVNVPGAKPMAAPAAPAVLDQKGCWFLPHIQIVAPGQKVNITNDDGILHNIHTTSKLNASFNQAQPKFQKVISKSFDKPEIVKLACDVHNWMNGWIVVAAHPYYALTGADGSFKIEGVPAGSYDVKFWHEKLGEQSAKVTVAASGDAKVDFSYPAK
jgi:plastocyanin